MKKEEVKNIVVIGASAGGISAVSCLLATFKQNLDAAIFVVIHISANSKPEVILNHLQKQTEIKCKIAVNEEMILNRTIYLSPADYHMMLLNHKIVIKKGAYENHWRPAIDVLFRSAAAAFNSHVTGIILTGLLDDGTSGMSAIKRSGGICMVQEPSEAEFPDMPLNVLHNVDVDYCVSIEEMAYILLDLFSKTKPAVTDVPEDVQLEAKIALRMSSEVEDVYKLGHLTPFTCPECGGTLVKIEEGYLKRYKCYTGHSFTEKSLEEAQIKAMEDSLWVAIRMMEERKNLLKVVGGNSPRATQLSIHIERLKLLMLDLEKKTNLN